jgi:ribulose-5-phosphate 4-epimerase/fuculose-1-phosphate aldolase
VRRSWARNHGIAVGEMDIPRAFFLLWTVQRAAEIQHAGSIPATTWPCRTASASAAPT